MRLYLYDSNIDIKEFIEKKLGGVSKELTSNPQFESQLYRAICFLTRQGMGSKIIPPMELVVLDNGRGFEIRSGIRKSPECGNEYLQNNKNYDQVRFTLDDNNCMQVLRSNGVFYQFDDYMRINMAPEYKNKFRVSNSQITPTIISTYHDHRTFTSDGIEVEHSVYTDQYPLSCSFENERELPVQTMIHSPRKWGFNVLPEPAPYEFIPMVTNAHRYTKELGSVHVQSRISNDKPIDYAVYASTTEYPDILGYTSNPYKKIENGKEVITEDYQKYFPNMEIWEVQREVNKSFYYGIKTSKSMDMKPEVCEKMQELTKESLVNKYGVNEDELSNERSR